MSQRKSQGIFLASTSPRRQAMLRELGIAFTTLSPDIDETVRPKESPSSYVRRMAITKANMGLNQALMSRKPGSSSPTYVLAADTIVVLGSRILGKPKSKPDALKMLTSLSSRPHRVLTCYAWGRCDGKSAPIVIAETVRTTVSFYNRPRSFWQWYASTSEPMDKAGSYAAQGIGLSFIKSFQGSYANVVGLPLAEALNGFHREFGNREFLRCFGFSIK